MRIAVPIVIVILTRYTRESWYEVLESQVSEKLSARYSAISNFCRSQITAVSWNNKCVISQLTVTILTNSQLSVNTHSDPQINSDKFFLGRKPTQWWWCNLLDHIVMISTLFKLHWFRKLSCCLEQHV